MGLIDQPQEWASWMNHSNPPDAIDYERPREGAFMSTTPTSINSADDDNAGWLGDAWESVKKFIGMDDSKEEEGEKELEELSKIVEKDTEKDTEKDIKKAPAKQGVLNSSFQSFFSKPHPIIGKLYSGPEDGKINPELKAAAQAAESKIASAIGDNGVRGLIWSGKGFATSPADVSSALDVIMKYKGKTSSFLSRDERIVAFSAIIQNK